MNTSRRDFMKGVLVAGAISGAQAGCASFGLGGGKRWYKGMLHGHTLWSDGHVFPEQATMWYRSHGYNFYCMSDHNRWNGEPGQTARVVEGTRWGWATCPKSFWERYRKEYGAKDCAPDKDGEIHAPLLTFDQIAARYDLPGEFMMVPGLESTHGYVADDKTEWDVHINVLGVKGNLRTRRPWAVAGVHSVTELIAGEWQALDELAAKQGVKKTLFVLNHPFWRWYSVGPESLIDLPYVRFFEVCNCGMTIKVPEGFPTDGYDTDRFWDVVNAFRARRGQPLLYGMGSDDSHIFYEDDGRFESEETGSAWVRVRADRLDWDALVDALHAGDFVACEGLEIDRLDFCAEKRRLTVGARAIPGKTLRVSFIVTKKDFSEKVVRTEHIVATEKSSGDVFRRDVNFYDMSKIGVTAKLVTGKPSEDLVASYEMADDDLYVRARFEADVKPKKPFRAMPKNVCCWTQPYLNPRGAR